MEEVAKVLLSWANLPAIALLSVLAWLTRRGINGHVSWLKGDSDLIIPAVWALLGAFTLEKSTAEFDRDMVFKRTLTYLAGVCVFYKWDMVIAAIPDPLLSLWPVMLGGEYIRKIAAARAAVSTPQKPVPAFKVGDVVIAKNGLKMTVIALAVDDSGVFCKWFVGDELHQGMFLAADLVKQTEV